MNVLNEEEAWNILVNYPSQNKRDCNTCDWNYYNPNACEKHKQFIPQGCCNKGLNIQQQCYHTEPKFQYWEWDGKSS